MRLQTPIGLAKWPKLHTPDIYVPAGGHPKPGDKGRYSVDLAFNPELEEVAAFLRDLERGIAEFRAEAEHKDAAAKFAHPYTSLRKEIDENDVETGMVVLTFNRGAGGISGRTGKEWSATVPIYDANGVKYVHDENRGEIGNGSTMRVEFEIRPYKMSGYHGITFQMSAVQVRVIEYHTGGAVPSAFAGNAIAPEDFQDSQKQADRADY